jgi:hypothetical protein
MFNKSRPDQWYCSANYDPASDWLPLGRSFGGPDLGETGQAFRSALEAQWGAVPKNLVQGL